MQSAKTCVALFMVTLPLLLAHKLLTGMPRAAVFRLHNLVQKRDLFSFRQEKVA